MNAKTKLSAKGQVVIPKDVRDHLGLSPGQTLDVIETGGGVLLRPVSTKTDKTTDEVLAELAELAKAYKGPTISLEEIDAAAIEAWGQRAASYRR